MAYSLREGILNRVQAPPPQHPGTQLEPTTVCPKAQHASLKRSHLKRSPRTFPSRTASYSTIQTQPTASQEHKKAKSARGKGMKDAERKSKPNTHYEKHDSTQHAASLFGVRGVESQSSRVGIRFQTTVVGIRAPHCFTGKAEMAGILEFKPKSENDARWKVGRTSSAHEYTFTTLFLCA